MSPFFEIWLIGFGAIMAMMSTLWIVSIPLKNVSIVDLFWGAGFVLAAGVYCARLDGEATPRQWMVLALVAIWGLRLSGYLTWRNVGHGEDFRYQKFRENFGDGYWWFSFFQVFLLQGVLMALVSAPLLGALYGSRIGAAESAGAMGWLDYVALAVWTVGFIFEAGSDLQLARFKSKPENQGKLVTDGFWRYTRHPNYFGDSAVWWGFGLFAVAAGQPWTALGSVLMTLFIIKVSGVALLEKSMSSQKPGYAEYAARTSAFLPWFPKGRR